MIHHVQLACPPGSEPALREFYGGVLGLDEIGKPPGLAARGGCWFAGHGIGLHLGAEEDFRPARRVHPGLRVSGLDAWAGRLRDAGYPMLFDDGFPGMRRFYSQDRNGNGSSSWSRSPRRVPATFRSSPDMPAGPRMADAPGPLRSAMGPGSVVAAGRPALERGWGMGVAEVIRGRLADGELVIIDGGMGSQLQAEGVPMDEVAWSARANLEQPDVVQRVHEAYIQAGAEVIIANTFAASRAGLAPAGLGGRVAEANRGAIRAALRAREAAATGPVAVAGSMSSFCPIAMDATALGAPLRNPAADDPRFPRLADFREQAALLAEAGADLIALEMIDGQGYGRAALQAAAETGLPVWLGISPDRRDDGTLGTLPELGDGDSFDDLLGALADPSLAAVTVMHADPGLTLDAIEVIRRHYAGPIGVYAETGGWQPPNWVFDGLTPGEYLQQAVTWAGHGAQLIGGCCGTGPGHIRALADGLARRPAGR